MHYVCGSIHEVYGPRLFTTSGHAYQHVFNISLCAMCVAVFMRCMDLVCSQHQATPTSMCLTSHYVEETMNMILLCAMTIWQAVMSQQRTARISRYSNVTHTHGESKKTVHTFVHNCDKCWPIFRILSLLYSPRNLQQSWCQHVPPHLKCVTALPCKSYYLKFNHFHTTLRPVLGWGTPLPPLSIYFPIFSPFYFFLSFIGFTYFLLLSIPFLSTRIVPLRFQAGGRRRRPNLGLVSFFVFFCVCNLCYLYSLVKMHCGVFWFTSVCSFNALTLLVGSFKNPSPYGLYYVGGTLNLTLSINQSPNITDLKLWNCEKIQKIGQHLSTLRMNVL